MCFIRRVNCLLLLRDPTLFRTNQALKTLFAVLYKDRLNPEQVIDMQIDGFQSHTNSWL